MSKTNDKAAAKAAAKQAKEDAKKAKAEQAAAAKAAKEAAKAAKAEKSAKPAADAPSKKDDKKADKKADKPGKGPVRKQVDYDGPPVRCIKLTKRYGDFVALDSLDLELERGKILGYIGPNGAGKTTTIKILVGLAKPTSGQAFIAGHDCSKDVRKIKQLVGYMPDVFGSYDNMRVREYLDFFGAAFKLGRKDRQRRIAEVMEITGATYMQDLYVEALSHGMKQRVGIARTLLHDPELLIFDEPANGLDPAARIDMRKTLLQLAEMGKTLIVTSHILPELSRICDLVGIVTHGKLQVFGTLEQIMRQLNQRRMMECTLTSSEDVMKLAGLLKEHLEADAEVIPSPAENEVRFSTIADDRKLAEILSAAVSRGILLTQYSEVELDLEDAFLEVTGLGDRHRGERADGGWHHTAAHVEEDNDNADADLEPTASV